MSRLLPALLVFLCASPLAAQDLPPFEDVLRTLEAGERWEPFRAAVLLGSTHYPTDRAVPVLLHALHENRDPQVRAAAASSLTAHLTPARFGDPTSKQTIEHCERHTKPAVPILIEALLDDPVWKVRMAALRTLAELESWAKPALPIVRRMLSDPMEGIFALRALAKIGPEPSDVPQLIKLLKRRGQGLRSHAAYVLGIIGPQAAPAVPPMVTVLMEDYEPEKVLWALGQIGHAARVTAVHVRARLKKTEKPVVRVAAIEALPRIAPNAETVEALAPLLEDESFHITLAGIRALGSMGAVAKPALGKLRELAKGKTAGLREAAQAAVRAIE